MRKFLKAMPITLLVAIIVIGLAFTLSVTVDATDDTASAENTVFDLSTCTADHVAQEGETITGTLDMYNGNYKISIADGATVKKAK